MSNKCYKCTKRTVGCHSTCEDYIEYRKQWDAVTEERDRQRALNDVLKSYNPQKIRGIPDRKLRKKK